MRLIGRLLSRSLHSSRRVMSSPKIQLTETESALCTLFDDCSKWLHQEHPDQGFVECRIAGGWVRDKLLGLQSNDIDIALSSMMGVPYAESLVHFMSTRGETIREPAKVARNPEQSKHLETAMVTVLGLDIDLVNLRSEVYAEGSRIPTEITFGTPVQDALRRDITINSLFYNVHSRSVEDLTRKGLEDLKNGIIRTPLAPRETFLDDPLRVLRCIRFASRYGFQIEPSVIDAIRDAEIQAAVRSKISRERVGVELDKMLKAKNPLLSLEMIDSLGLYSSVFWLPDAIAAKMSAQPAGPEQGLLAASILHSILLQPTSSSPVPSHIDPLTDPAPRYPIRLPPINPKLLELAITPESRRRLYLAAALSPFDGITIPEKKRNVPATEGIIREGVKLGTQNHYMDGIPPLFVAATKLSHPTLGRLEPSSVYSETFPLPTTQRAAIGLLLRDKSVHNPVSGSDWAASLLFSLVQDLLGAWRTDGGAMDDAQANETVKTYNAFFAKIEELDLLHIADDTPLLNGGEVCSLLSLKPSPQIKPILDRVVEWQISHPGESKEACEAFIKAEQEAGTLLPASLLATLPQQGGGEKKRKGGQDGKEGKKTKKATAAE